MSSCYYRVKKWRALRKQNQNQCEQCTSDEPSIISNDPNIDNSVLENNNPSDELLSVPEVDINLTDSESVNSAASNQIMNLQLTL